MIVQPMWVWVLHFITARVGRVIPILILMTHPIALTIMTSIATITNMATTDMDSIAMDITSPAITMGGIWGGIGGLAGLVCRNLDFTVAGIRDCIGKRIGTVFMKDTSAGRGCAPARLK